MPVSGLGVVRFVVLELRRSLMDVMDSSSTIRSEVTERCLPSANLTARMSLVTNLLGD